MALPKLSLQNLEAFEVVARCGSMQQAAQELGQSISTVSHNVARLEAELGVALLDRSSRPFELTREGRETLHHLSRGLRHLRRATSATAIGGLLGTRSLRIGIVEDFESNLAPEIAVTLAGRMPHASLAIHSVLSHEVPARIRKGQLDLAIAAAPQEKIGEMRVIPLIKDPFIAAVPSPLVADMDPVNLINGKTELPFLRFNKNHLIGAQIDAHLSRNRISLPQRFMFDSVQSIMAVIANRGGWSIITPLGFLRAQRYASQVQLLPLPIAGFARQICLLARADFDPNTADAITALIHQSLTPLLGNQVLQPYSWLEANFGRDKEF